MDSRANSVVLDRKAWEGNPKYFFKTIPPRISKYAERADDACIQTQIDVFGKDNVGIIQGSLASAANFASTIYSESLPERLPILAYLNEILSFYEAFEREMAEMTGATMDLEVPKDPKFDNPVWQANFKHSLPKILKIISQADTNLGPKCVMAMKELAETPNLSPRMPTYKTMDEYLAERIDDIAWPSVFACAEFGASLNLTKEHKASVDEIFRPLWIHSCCAYDHYTWEKEVKVSASHGKGRNIINGIALLNRLHGLSVDEAKEWLKRKCLESEEEYLGLKEAYLSKNPEESLPEDLRRWFDCQEAIATGFAIWCATTYRHHPPHEAGYHQYYAKRLQEGAVWFDNATDSETLMPERS
ncbi:Fusicoccadiene synthase [Tolypocladium ophioglossoides CBS 100239]|uniref:Fusicoccadiene synthase n=1 Tax=Tolypocladium ophioglossoides (strain CBS 100239) TaxID=1163406 RepID=A0A0L0MZI6_TOLOC|nr:Fusicoccadiene synthase [Tolypocladium ophioglossoides CBS 100239]